MPQSIDELQKIRLEKLKKLETSGISGFPAWAGKREPISEVREKGLEVSALVAGRLMGLRGHGVLDQESTDLYSRADQRHKDTHNWDDPEYLKLHNSWSDILELKAKLDETYKRNETQVKIKIASSPLTNVLAEVASRKDMFSPGIFSRIERFRDIVKGIVNGPSADEPYYSSIQHMSDGEYFQKYGELKPSSWQSLNTAFVDWVQGRPPQHEQSDETLNSQGFKRIKRPLLDVRVGNILLSNPELGQKALKATTEIRDLLGLNSSKESVDKPEQQSSPIPNQV